jgi:hypothetical protein
MDTTTLRTAYRDFLAVVERGDFAGPPPGEWTAGQLLAHVVATDTGITAIALAVAAGQRPTYDNRYALDGWNLARLAARPLPELADTVRRRGELLCRVAEDLDDAELSVPVHCLILSGCTVMADGPLPLAELINGIGAVHLPGHAAQLAALSRSVA